MKLIQTIENLSLLDKKILVWAFIPCLSLDQDFSNEEFDPAYFQQELAEVFAELNVAWKFKLITLENMTAMIEEVAASQTKYFPIVLNYCAGLDEIDGYPGASVVKLLEAKGIPFTGADSQFFKMGDSKILMKQAFVEAGVSTAPSEVINNVNSIRGLCDRLQPPLIVKPSASFGTRGISLQSVVHTDEEAIAQFEDLQQGKHGMQILAESIFVERFIKGREFTVLLVGTAQQSERIEIYPPVETVFHSGVPETERFYTRELWIAEAEERTLPPHQEPLFGYQLAPIELHDRLGDLAKCAYCAVGGTGYGRVDIRMDETTQEMFVLEVNPGPAITSRSLTMGVEEPNTSRVGTVLHLAGIPFAQLMSEIIAEAFTRHSTELLLSKDFMPLFDNKMTEEIFMLQELPVSRDKLFVWAFIPYEFKAQELISDYDYSTIRQDLGKVFAELEIKWKWQPITLENMHAVVEEVTASRNESIPIILNYCDGNEIDGYPGISVIKLLETKGIIFTGADSNFFDITSSKILMKRAFLQSGVSTAPYEVISNLNDIKGICQRLNTPLLVKPSDYYGGAGLSNKSVVHSDEEIHQHLQFLLQEQQQYQFSLGNLFVERFIDGREFTVLILGSAQQPNQLKIYPPLELIFHSSLYKFEKFKSHQIHLENSLEGFLIGQLVISPLSDQISDLAKRAYCALGGNGYGRVDIRMDNASQELFVLEVNANCGISSQPISPFLEDGQTSVGTILHQAGIPFAQLISEIIAEAFARNSTKSRYMSTTI